MMLFEKTPCHFNQNALTFQLKRLDVFSAQYAPKTYRANFVFFSEIRKPLIKKIHSRNNIWAKGINIPTKTLSLRQNHYLLIN